MTYLRTRIASLWSRLTWRRVWYEVKLTWEAIEANIWLATCTLIVWIYAILAAIE